ncbi:Fic family protein [Afifella sp. JA880]|uniref:Fic family protein n=1 Tax=unclassified Afifella TaxID=2624128 RepID=UPI0021BB7A6F|nr:Fic family protein [Afifella sp. JA880]MCT8267708.1 Fic family protein [Afifella sp. JA880]
MLVLEEENGDLYVRMQEQNLLRQYDYMTNCVEIGLQQGRAFDKYMLWVLNHIAVANISAFGGRYREEPIYVGDHKPPHFKDVGDWMDRFISNVHENWYIWSPTELAAYGLWRLNWIHPFVEGNGRTARAASYYLLCVRAGALLPGRKILPERIREDRRGYEDALAAADQAWENGHLDFTEMEDYLAALVQAQLEDEGLPYQR